MQVSIETVSGLERRLTIGVPAEKVDSEVSVRLKKAARTVRIDGFRAGKVPVKVVKQRYGAGIRQEVLGEIMSQSFYEAIEQEKIKPAGQPSIEPKEMGEGTDFEFVATFEVYPEVKLTGFGSINVEKLNAEITDDDVEKMIDTLRTQQATFEVVDQAAENGNQVNIDFQGTKDGESFEGGSAEGSDLELGSGRMIPGFEDAIIGMKSGEEKTADLSFPEDYHAEELKGAAVAFKIKVNTVSEKEQPALNDEFFAKFGVKEGGEDAFRQEVRKNMGRELEQAAKNKIKNQVMEGLLADNTFDLPSALVSSEITTLRNQAFQQFGGGGAQLDPSILPDELFNEQAERRVSLGLILSEVIQSESVKPDADRVKKTIEEMAATYEDPQQVIEYYYGNEQQLASIENLVLEEMVVEKILESATVTEKSSNYDEVLKPEPAPQSKEEGADDAEASED